MTTMRFADAGAVRAVMDGERRVLEVLAIPYGGPGRRDRYNQWFDAQTDIMAEVGDRRPAIFLHGFSPRLRRMERPAVLAAARITRRDERGVWMETDPLGHDELSDRVWEAAKAGRAGASSDSVDHLVRPQPVNGEYPAGRVAVWPLAGISLFDKQSSFKQVSDDAVVLPLRAIFRELDLDLPEAFEAGEDKDATREQCCADIRTNFQLLYL